MQEAIWMIEEEIPLDVTNKFYADAALNNWTTTGSVTVWNLYDQWGNPKQDFLHLPEPTSLILLGSGLLGLAFARRKMS
jgi:hypothetical protein